MIFLPRFKPLAFLLKANVRAKSAIKMVPMAAVFWICGVANAQFCPQTFDSVAAPSLPAGWTATVLQGAVTPWKTQLTAFDTSPNAVFAADPAFVSDNVLDSPSTLVTDANLQFYFRHSYNTETYFDGGVLEISVDGNGFNDLVSAGGGFSLGGYNSTIEHTTNSPIADRVAWSGNSGGFISTGVRLPTNTLGHSVIVRWRAASDESFSATGWYVDSIGCGPPPAAPPAAWSFAAPYPIPTVDQGMTSIGSTLYSFGGVTTDSQQHAIRRSAAYRFSDNAWTPIAALPVALQALAVTSDASYAYIIGGVDGSTTVTNLGYRYDPGANTYTSIASSPTPAFGSAAVYLDGKVYKIAGFVDTAGNPTNAVEAYDVQGNSWSTVAPYPSAMGFVSAFVHDHFIYVAGGVNKMMQATLKAYRYDPVTDVWDDNAFADLPQVRWGAASANYHSGGLVAGGFVNGSNDANISATALQWTAQTNAWTALPNMLLARARSGGTVLRGCFFAVGGRSPTGVGINFFGTTENQTLDCLFYDDFER